MSKNMIDQYKFLAVLDNAGIAYKFNVVEGKVIFSYMCLGKQTFNESLCKSIEINNNVNNSDNINILYSELEDEINRMNTIIQIEKIKKEAIKKLQLTLSQEELDVLGLDINKLKN